ncbi:MAG: hypothetical protein ACRDYD_08240, partial [Acidimicrobiales bacterium]
VARPPGGGRERALLLDWEGGAVMALRDDGPTGLHVVGTDGRALALASAANDPEPSHEALDVLLLASHVPLGRIGLLSLLMSGVDDWRGRPPREEAGAA